MPATLITSAAAFGKTKAAVHRIQQLKENDPFAKIWVLLPTPLQIAPFRTRLIDGVEDRIMFGVEFFNFYSLNAHLLEVAGIPQRRVDGAAQYRILREVVNSVHLDLRHFDRIAHMPGFIGVLAGFFLELKQALIDPEHLMEAARTDKDRDLALVYRHYQAFLQTRDLVDREGEGWLALAWLQKQQQAEVLASALLPRLLVIDGYDQFSVVQAKLLTQLAALLPETLLTLTYEEARSETAHRRFAETKRRLDQIEAEQPNFVWDYQATPLVDDQRVAGLTALSARIFEFGHGEPQMTEAVLLLEAPDRRREIQAILQSIKRGLLEGLRPDQIAIVARDPSEYAAYLDEYASAYGIPLRMGHGTPLSDNPAVATILGLAAIAQNQFRRRDLLDRLRSPYVASPLSLDQLDLLDRISREYAVLGKREAWFEALQLALQHAALGEPHADQEAGDEEPITSEVYGALRQQLTVCFDRLTPPALAQARDHVKWFETLIGADPSVVLIGDEDATPDLGFGIIRQIREGSNLSLIERDIVAVRRLKSVLQDFLSACELVDATQLYTWSAFFAELQQAIAAATVDSPRMPSRLGHVLFASVFQIRGLPHEHLYIVGLSEGGFPRAAPEDLLYLDSDRRDLNARDIPLLMRAAEADETSVFYELTALARQRLTLTRPYLDEKGAPLAPSPYWRAVQEAVRGTVFHIGLAQPLTVETALHPAEAMQAAAQVLTQGLSQGGEVPHSAQIGPLLAWLNAEPSRASSWSNVRHGQAIEAARLEARLPHDAYSGHIQHPAALAQVAATLGPNRMWSASQFNDYGHCPYRFFAKRLLRLQQVKEPEEGMDQLQHGVLVHAMLQDTYQQVADEGMVIEAATVDQALEILDQVLEQHLSNAPLRYNFRPSSLWQQEQGGYRKQLRALIKADFTSEKLYQKLFQGGQRRTLRLEAPFIDLILEGAAGPLRVRGAIDRIDEVDGRLLVLDYKTGSTPIQEGELIAGRNVQMLLYLRAAAALYPDRELLGAAFLHVGKKTLSGVVSLDLQPELALSLLADAQANLQQRVLLARQGIFINSPSKPSGGGEVRQCSSYCEFSQLCRARAVSNRKLLAGISSTD